MYKKVLGKFKKLKFKDSSKKIGPFFRQIVSRSRDLFGRIGKALGVFSQSNAFKISVKVFAVLAVILSVFQFAFGVMIYGLKANDKITKTVGKILPYPVAVANYDFITYSEYQKEKDYIHHFYSATQQEEIDYNVIDQQILDQLVENKIIGFEAIKYDVSVNKKEVDDAINNIIVQNGGQAEVEKVLRDLYGLSLNDFRRLVKVQLLRDKINDKVIARVEARHILIRVDSSATPEQVEAARVKIQGISDEIKGGLDFSEAAKKYSEDTGSAEQGGLLEPFAKGEMVEEFSNTAFATKVGEISEPVKTEFGWHIIKVEKRTGTIEMKFSDWISDLAKKGLILKFI